MNNKHLIALCERLGLGVPLGEPQSVNDGPLHRVWRLNTTQGSYAVKQLNSALLRQPGMRAAYRRAEQIAAAMAAQGVPAVRALTTARGPVQTIGGSSVLVFPWVEGTTLPPGQASPAQARQIGAILGRMHTLHLSLPGLDIPAWQVFRDDDWVLLGRRAAEQQPPWEETYRQALRDIRWWSMLAKDANKRLWNTLVVSHRDLDRPHVFWRDAMTPAIIDWETAGLVNPSLELAGTALTWSGFAAGVLDESSFRAVVEGYRSGGGTLRDSAHDALSGCMGAWLARLEVNMRRSLGESSSNPDEQALASTEVSKTLNALQALADNLGLLAGWLER